MSVTIDPPAIEPPDSLPVDYLSVSSLTLYSRCPEKWMRRYLLHESDPPSGKMLLGSSAGAALSQHFGRVIEDGEGLTTGELLDEYSAEWDERTGRDEVDYGGDAPGTLKDSGAAALAIYHQQIAPTIVPVSVERQIELSWPAAPFKLTGYLDLETEAGKVCDFKMTGQRWSADKAAAELQPTVYLAARRAEGNPATGFDYHTMVKVSRPYAEIVPAARTDHQLDLLTHRVFSIARSMQWRWLNDCWAGTPPDLAWLCRGCSAQDCAWRLG